MDIAVRRVIVTLITLFVLSPTMAMAAAWYRCTMDGQARAACCCPAESNEEIAVPADAPPSVRVSCCCNIETVSAPVSQPRMTADSAAAALAATIVPRLFTEIDAPKVQIAIRPAQAEARPSSRAPPLFLSHCSLLI